MPGSRRARPSALLALALLVLCLHAWLASRWGLGEPRSSLRAGPALAPALQVRQLGVMPPPNRREPGTPAAADAQRSGAPPVPPVPTVPPVPLALVANAPVMQAPVMPPPHAAALKAAKPAEPAEPAVAPAKSAAAAAAAAQPATMTAPPGAGSQAEPAAAGRVELAALVEPVEPAELVEPAEPASDEGGTPPPLYPTRLPAPVQLRYALSYNGQPGEATLSWQHDGQRYAMALSGLGQGTGRPLLAQSSQGALDANGLAPDRFVDRRRGGRQQAANFRRDIERIGFSGPSQQFPAWPGAQDRLSWLAQLAAILAAGHAEPEVRLFVVDARGQGGAWRLQRLPDERLATPRGEAWLQRWRRDPPRPEGLQVQVWLDPMHGHWPVLLRFTAMRSGDVVELRLQHEPKSP